MTSKSYKRKKLRNHSLPSKCVSTSKYAKSMPEHISFLNLTSDGGARSARFEPHALNPKLYECIDLERSCTPTTSTRSPQGSSTITRNVNEKLGTRKPVYIDHYRQLKPSKKCNLTTRCSSRHFARQEGLDHSHTMILQSRMPRPPLAESTFDFPYDTFRNR